MARELSFAQQAERSISKRFRKEIWTPFIHAIQEYELIREGYRNMHIGFMLEPVNATLRRVYHFDLKDTSPRDALKGNQVPICLIHGKEDKFIDPSNSEELAKATAGYCELHLIDGATHAKSRKVLGEEAYTKIVREFLENIEKIPEPADENE